MARWGKMAYNTVAQYTEYRATIPNGGGTLRVWQDAPNLPWSMAALGRFVAMPVETLEEACLLCETKAVELLSQWLAAVTE